jgi:hypothetical protein
MEQGQEAGCGLWHSAPSLLAAREDGGAAEEVAAGVDQRAAVAGAAGRRGGGAGILVAAKGLKVHAAEGSGVTMIRRDVISRVTGRLDVSDATAHQRPVPWVAHASSRL